MIKCQLSWLMALLLTSWISSDVRCEVQLSHVSTIYLPQTLTPTVEYSYPSTAADHLSYDKDNKLIYVVGNEMLHVVDASDPTNLDRKLSMQVPDADFTDVEVCGHHVFVTIKNMLDKMDGQLRVYRKHARGSTGDLELVRTVSVGSLPEMLQPRPDCRTVVVALGADAYVVNGTTLQDPKGAVVIVHFPEGVEGDTAAQVKTLDFRLFNDRYEELLPSGVRYVYRHKNFSHNVEPKYVTIDEKSNIAYVCLQENNAIAEVDLATETITKIHGLGYKDWGGLDASDKDQAIAITYWPIKALYQPDTIKYHAWRGHRLVFTANEGVFTRYKEIDFDDSIRGNKITDTGPNLSPIVKAALGMDDRLGRLMFSRVDGRDQNGHFETLYTFGGRGFSIWDASNNFQQLFDSGSHVEESTALYCPYLFNADNDNFKVDMRSDSKGPETESIALGEIDGRLVIFIGNERPGTISVYSIGDDPTKLRFEHIFCDGIPNNGKTWRENYDARIMYAVDPEELKFLPEEESPADYPVLLVVGAESGTLSLLRVNATGPPGKQLGEGPSSGGSGNGDQQAGDTSCPNAASPSASSAMTTFLVLACSMVHLKNILLHFKI